MKTTKQSGVIAAIRYGSKAINIVLKDGNSVPVSFALAESLAKSMGAADLSEMALLGPGSTISFDKVEIAVGDSLGNDRNGQPIINKNTGTNLYGTAHTRYNNISIVMSEQRIQSKLQAAAYGRALAAAYALPSLPKLPESNSENGRVETTIIDTTTGKQLTPPADNPALSEIANAFAEETQP